jgi:predicted neutral ceramidase superfamily lipid hydrolase
VNDLIGAILGFGMFVFLYTLLALVELLVWIFNPKSVILEKLVSGQIVGSAFIIVGSGVALVNSTIGSLIKSPFMTVAVAYVLGIIFSDKIVMVCNKNKTRSMYLVLAILSVILTYASGILF